jgi:hypothetical protein
VEGFMYQDRQGNMYDAKSCKKELRDYIESGIKDTTPIDVSPESLKKKILKLIPSNIKTSLKKII